MLISGGVSLDTTAWVTGQTIGKVSMMVSGYVNANYWHNFALLF